MPRAHRPAIQYAPARDAHEVNRYAAAIARGFQWPDDWARRWVREHGDEMVRLARIDDDMAGGLLLMPMDTFIGGREVSLCGIVTVVVPPEMRGLGAGTELMRRAVLEMREQGHALSGLYPATLPVYRNAGYEQAGVRCETRINLKQTQLNPAPPEAADLRVREAVPSDDFAIRTLYARHATATNGHLLRPDSIWSLKVRAWRGEPTRGYVVTRGDQLVGYIYFCQQRVGLNPFDIIVTDLVAPEPGAAWRLMAFLADHWSMAGEAVWTGSPDHPALMHLRDRSYTTRTLDKWTLRVLDVAKAFQQRGYTPELAGSVEFRVQDPLIPDNQRAFKLEIDRGVGRITPAEHAALHLDIRALAPLASGYADAQVLADAGLASGDPPALQRLVNLCRLATPWMTEIY